MERSKEYVKLSLRKYSDISEENDRYKKLIDKNMVEIHPCRGSYVITKNKAIKQLALQAKIDIEKAIINGNDKEEALKSKISDLEHCIKAMYADLSRKDKKRYEKVTAIQDAVFPALTRCVNALRDLSKY